MDGFKAFRIRISRRWAAYLAILITLITVFTYSSVVFARITGSVRVTNTADEQYVTWQMGSQGSYPVETTDVPEVVNFPDPNLEALIRNAIDKPTGDIYDTDLLPLETLIGNDKGITDLTGLEYCINLSSLFLPGNQISDISPLQNLTNLTRIYLLENQITDISPLQNLTKLTHLYLYDNQINDISQLQNLTLLKNLELANNQIVDITVLQHLISLETLILRNNQIVDITALQNITTLRYIFLHNNQINDISSLVANAGLATGAVVGLTDNPLSSESVDTHIPALQARGVSVVYESLRVTFPDSGLDTAIREAIDKPTGDIYGEDLLPLETLYGFDKGIINLTGLEHCINLTNVFFTMNQIVDITTLQSLPRLSHIDLGMNQVVNIDALQDNIAITNLYLNNNLLNDITPLLHNYRLNYLYLNNNLINDITPVQHHTNLNILDLSNNQIFNINALQKLTNLYYIDLSNNLINDMTPLQNHNPLYLYLSNNLITDVTPVQNHTNLIELFFDNNQIVNIDALQNLANLYWLNLYSNQVVDISSLADNAGLATGDTVDLTDNPLGPESLDTHIPALQDRGVTVYYGPPMSVITEPASDITPNSATLNGILDDLGPYRPGPVFFDWGMDTSYGNETPPQLMPGIGRFEAEIFGLDPGTTYHFRAKTVVNENTAYGDDMTFDTLTCGDVNYDGIVNMADAMILWYDIAEYPSAGAWTISSEWAADVNCDEVINMADVMILWYDIADYPSAGAWEINCCE